MQRKIVFEGLSKKGNKIVICYPTKDDAQIFCDYINALSKEKTFIRFQGEEISLKDEGKYLKDKLEKIAKKEAVELFVFFDNKLIGISEINMKDKTESHEGVLGISIAKEYREEGIGKIFMQTILQEAEKNIPQLRIITLGVFGNNPLAINMYKKFGFREYGKLPGGSLHRGKYIDHIHMYKNVKID
jgi:RimJ/RimL family protein N-acetyltransferase